MATSHRKGEFFALSDGEYSAYAFHGLYRALVDIDMAKVADDIVPYLKSTALLRGHAIPEPDEFGEYDSWDLKYVLGLTMDSLGGYLVKQGLAEPIDYDEIHAGYDLDLSRLKLAAQTRAANLAQQDQS